jgi:hypothetical protein
MTGTGTEGLGLTGTLRLTWVTGHLAHVLEMSEAGSGETSGTWTGLSCPDHGLPIGSDVDNTTLLRLAGQGGIADLIGEAPPEFTADHGQLCVAALQAHESGRAEEGQQLWQQMVALWSHAWSTNYQMLELMQNAGLTRFSPVKPQRWVIASFEHHTSPHGLQQPHIHNIVIPDISRAGMNGYQALRVTRHEHRDTDRAHDHGAHLRTRATVRFAP